MRCGRTRRHSGDSVTHTIAPSVWQCASLHFIYMCAFLGVSQTPLCYSKVCVWTVLACLLVRLLPQQTTPTQWWPPESLRPRVPDQCSCIQVLLIRLITSWYQRWAVLITRTIQTDGSRSCSCHTPSIIHGWRSRTSVPPCMKGLLMDDLVSGSWSRGDNFPVNYRMKLEVHHMIVMENWVLT